MNHRRVQLTATTAIGGVGQVAAAGMDSQAGPGAPVAALVAQITKVVGARATAWVAGSAIPDGRLLEASTHPPRFAQRAREVFNPPPSGLGMLRNGPRRGAWLADYGYRWCAVVPVRVYGQVVGAVVVTRDDAPVLDSAENAFLVTAVELTGLGVELSIRFGGLLATVRALRRPGLTTPRDCRRTRQIRQVGAVQAAGGRRRVLVRLLGQSSAASVCDPGIPA